MSNAIEKTFLTYGDNNRTAAEGFVTWAWDQRLETIYQLGTRIYHQLADEIVYTVHQNDMHCTEDEARAWLEENREILGEALINSID